MYREFKTENATVRVFGTVNEERLKTATVNFMKGVEHEKKKMDKKSA